MLQFKCCIPTILFVYYSMIRKENNMSNENLKGTLCHNCLYGVENEFKPIMNVKKTNKMKCKKKINDKNSLKSRFVNNKSLKFT